MVGAIAARECTVRDRVTGRDFTLFVRPDGRLLVNIVLGKGHPVAVLSIPKSGTYLMASLLQQLGYVDTELHVASTTLTDYRGLSVAEKRTADVDGRAYWLLWSSWCHL